VAGAAAPDLALWLVGRDRLAARAAFADPRLDLAVAQRLSEWFGVVAAVGPDLARLDPALQ
jgi:hypothetical protein